MVTIMTGKKNVVIHDEDGAEIASYSYYPNDAAGILKRLYGVASDMQSMDIGEATMDDINRVETEICNGLDEALKTNPSKTLFAVLSPLSLIDDGTPFIGAVLTSIIEEVKQNAEQKAAKISAAVNNAV